MMRVLGLSQCVSAILAGIVVAGLGVPAMARDVENPADPAYMGAKSLNYINTWLVAGTFENDKASAGLDKDWVGEATVRPTLGQSAGDTQWTYFDDRLFSRNYDDYQDLFSYFKTKLKQSVSARIVYAHVYVFSPVGQKAQLRLGADSQMKAFLNGKEIIRSTNDAPDRDAVKASVSLVAGWNRLLLKVGNTQNGPLGLYARFSHDDGSAIEGLTYSTSDSALPLSIATVGMRDIQTGDLPTAWRQWPYVTMDAGQVIYPGSEPFTMCRPFLQLEQIPRSSAFALQAAGGKPPFKWTIREGKLPAGMNLAEDGRLLGTPESTCNLGDYAMKVQVQDSAGAEAEKSLTLALKERPNAWFQQAGLVGLIHAPEKLSSQEIPLMAQTMKRQGYQLGMVISYNNGDKFYRYPSLFEPIPARGDVVGQFKQALEDNGIRFGMYFGMNEAALNAENGGKNGTILMLEEALDKFQPKALFFDWAGLPSFSLDSIYSMIKSKSPETMIVLNGMPTLCYGDWDVICMEGLGASGASHWDMKPFNVPWPKYPVEESWRHMVGEAGFFGATAPQVDPVAFQKITIAMIGEGFAADIDHTGKSGGKESRLEDSPMFQSHAKMADWASPKGMPELYRSYTNVRQGPIQDAPWGYSLSSLDGLTIYLHLTQNPWGKSGRPAGDTLSLDLPGIEAKRAVWMNQNREIPFAVDKSTVSINLNGVTQDAISTIVKLELAKPCVPAAGVAPATPSAASNSGSKNLALGKPALLLSPDGSHNLTPSVTRFARFGVDGIASTSACGAFSWDWAFQVDLQGIHALEKVAIEFGGGYATAYDLLVSADGKKWRTLLHVTECKGEKQEHLLRDVSARYVRVLAIAPNGPNQEGGQMQIAELAVFGR